MKTPTQPYKSIIPPLVCASAFALASWLLFALASPKSDTAGLYRLSKLRLLKEHDQSRLESYSWVDRAKGWVRIPISRAMELEERRLHAIPPHNTAADSSQFTHTSLVETPP